MLVKINEDFYEVPSAGLCDDEVFYFSPGISRCGNIKDGVSFSIRPKYGAFIISYGSLLEMVKLATEKREELK